MLFTGLIYYEFMNSVFVFFQNLVLYPSGYTPHQPSGNENFGYTKVGNLLKKSDGKVRKVWQKRKCEIRDGFLYISHSDVCIILNYCAVIHTLCLLILLCHVNFKYTLQAINFNSFIFKVTYNCLS